MSTFFIAILAGVAWMGLTADVGAGAFALGAVVGLGVWRFQGGRARRRFGPLRALRLAGLGARLLLIFLWELAVANVEQLRIVLAPRIDVQPGWIRFRSELETPAMRALLGAMLLRFQGWVTLQRTRMTMAQGQLPAMEMLEGVLLIFSGALLLTPGFVTDAIGFALLVPPLRQGLIRWFIGKSDSHFQQFGGPPGNHRSGHYTIDGEYHRDDD